MIIAGSRTISESIAYIECVKWQSANKDKEITEVVSGTAKGVDTAGEEYADFHRIPVKKFYPDWNTHGKAAGPIRNRQMAEYADALLLIWDGTSRGSASMKTEMSLLGKPVYEVIIKPKEFEPIRGYWSDSDDI